MESAKGKVCPFKIRSRHDVFCDEASCAWWCSFANDCAVPLLTGLIADSTINQVSFGTERKETEDGK